MTKDSRQLALPLPMRTALGRSDYYITDSNTMALAQVERWRDWPQGKCVLTGPEGAGKTHLAHVWAAQTGAQLIAARDLARQDLAALADGPLCLEDVDDIAGQAEGEIAMFHMHNLMAEGGQPLLMTARSAPSRWPLVLPDLASRMEGTAVATLGPPDDVLLEALLVKLFADRQIVPPADVVPYLVARMPRNYSAARDIVAALDAAALTRPGGVNRPLARDVLRQLSGPRPEGEPD